MIYLSQRDPRWSTKRLGASALTVGRYGCTTTCISMISDYFRCFSNPGVLASNPDNYTREGLILWTALRFPTMKFEWRQYGQDDVRIHDSLKDPNKAVILQVDNGAHWILAIRKTLFGLGSDYVCVDPWTGKTCTAKGTYKNITGSAHFVRK